MKELNVLKDKIETLIEEYFDEKVRYYDWEDELNDRREYEEIRKECISEVLGEIAAYDEEADDYIEELEERYAPPEPSDYDLDCAFRQRELAEEMRRY